MLPRQPTTYQANLLLSEAQAWSFLNSHSPLQPPLQLPAVPKLHLTQVPSPSLCHPIAHITAHIRSQSPQSPPSTTPILPKLVPILYPLGETPPHISQPSHRTDQLLSGSRIHTLPRTRLFHPLPPQSPTPCPTKPDHFQGSPKTDPSPSTVPESSTGKHQIQPKP